MNVALIPSASSPFVVYALVTVDERAAVDGESHPNKAPLRPKLFIAFPLSGARQDA